MNVSIVIPTYRGAQSIPYGLKSLGKQSFKNFEVIIVVKPSGDGTENTVQEICNDSNFQYKVLIQNEGHVTRAYNTGINYAKGDLVLFMDDDAIVPRDWIESYVNAYGRFHNSGAISGRDVPYPMTQVFSPSQESSRLKRQMIQTMHRGWQYIKPIFNKPHPIFRKYLLGIYITQSFKVATGFGIPYKRCLSLPVRGVNMSFKREAIEDAYFPEHPSLKIAPNLEQYFAAQLVLRGWNSIYDPDIQVFHIPTGGLSTSPRNDKEREIVRKMIGKLFAERTKQ
jgi:glycosyltransferase involved in cell wall biosynthesis